MSFKRYAILAAVSQHQQQLHQSQQLQLQQQRQHNATILSTATATPTTTTMTARVTTMGSTSLPANSAEQQLQDDEDLETEEEDGDEELPQHSTYYQGGIGHYNQQRGNLAGGGGGGGISLLNGAAGSSSSSGSGIGNSHGTAGGIGSQSYAHVVNGSVNLLLGGSMLCLVTTILCVVCYCCHRNIKKRTEAAYRQQQHQWLETDPNMEIYSVEQCYETSGLFLGDSTDGLAALPALHHEPPPSYDAVVLHEQQLLQQQQQQLEEQQLQLQQQQLLLQRVSPPPGYRSTLDINSCMQQVAASGVANAGGSVDAIAGGSTNTPPIGETLAHNKQLQRTLNAQSCCSLQRAEVENMWNATAASAAAVARHGGGGAAAGGVGGVGNCQELEMYMASPLPLPLQALQARKNAQAAMRLNSFGRRYLQQSQHQQMQHMQHMQQHSHYRRGCPLCGKFRYAGEEDMLAASLESGLEHCDDVDVDAEAEAATDDNDNVAVAEAPTLRMASTAYCQNGNQIDADADAANGNVVTTSSSSNTSTSDVIANEASEAIADPIAIADIDENDNATEMSAATLAGATVDAAAVAAEAAADAAVGTAAASLQDINNINENGIISLDMSKIIDISGLPTYEGALKLESSGYV